MNENQELVIVSDGRPITTSLILAASFGKEHKHVMRDIRKLECSKEFRESNFGLTSYTDAQCKTRHQEIGGFRIIAAGKRGNVRVWNLRPAEAPAGATTSVRTI